MAQQDTLMLHLYKIPEILQHKLLEILKGRVKRDLHMGTLPFVSREVAVKALDEVSDFHKIHEGCNNPDIDELLRILDFDPWVEITAINDTKRKRMNTITGEVQEGDSLGIDALIKEGWN